MPRLITRVDNGHDLAQELAGDVPGIGFCQLADEWLDWKPSFNALADLVLHGIERRMIKIDGKGNVAVVIAGYGAMKI